MTGERWQQISHVYRSALEHALARPSRHVRQSRDAGASWFEHDEASSKSITKSGDDIDDRLTERGPGCGGKANQDDARRVRSLDVRQLAEVLVFRQKHPFFGVRDREHDLVVRAGLDLNHCRHVMTSCTERSDDHEVTALIGEKPHALLSRRRRVVSTDEHDLLVRDGVSGIAHGGVNIFPSELRIGVEKIGLGRAFAEFAQNQFDRNPGPANHRLAEHDARVDFDAIGDRHRIRIHPVSRRIASTLVPSAAVS